MIGLITSGARCRWEDNIKTGVRINMLLYVGKQTREKNEEKLEIKIISQGDRSLQDLRVDGKIILKQMLNKYAIICRQANA